MVETVLTLLAKVKNNNTEHKRATRNGDVNNQIAEHHLQRSALYSTHQNHTDREGLRLNFGHLVTCYTNERSPRCFDVFASRGFAFLLL